MWKPEAESAYVGKSEETESASVGQSKRVAYHPASKWVDNFLIHDDNFGMYLSLPVGSLKKITYPKYDPLFRARHAFLFMPKPLLTNPLEAEQACSVITHELLTILDSVPALDVWGKRLFDSPKSRVIRTFLVTKEEYSDSLQVTADSFDKPWLEEQVIEEGLPPLFWLSEVSTIELYCVNKTRIADFIYSCDYPEVANGGEIYKRWLRLRLPNILITRVDAVDGQPIAQFHEMTSGVGHFRVHKFKSQEDTLDW